MEKLDSLTVQLFEKAHAESSKNWRFLLEAYIPKELVPMVVEFGSGQVDVDILERILFYDNHYAVRHYPGLEWDDLKSLLGENYPWSFLYSEHAEWNHSYLFGAESHRYPPEGFCARPLCMINCRSCACGPDRQLPLRHVGQYVMHEGRYVYGAVRIHRLDAAIELAWHVELFRFRTVSSSRERRHMQIKQAT